MKIKSILGPHVLLRPDRERDKQHGSIIIPEAHRAIVATDERSLVRKSDMWTRGTVVMLGTGARRQTPGGQPLQGRIPVDLEVEQVVVYRRADASPMPETDGLVLVHVDSIMGAIEEELDWAIFARVFDGEGEASDDDVLAMERAGLLKVDLTEKAWDGGLSWRANLAAVEQALARRPR